MSEPKTQKMQAINALPMFDKQPPTLPPLTSELRGVRGGFELQSRDPVSGSWLIATLMPDDTSGSRKRLALTIGDLNTSMTTTYQGLTQEQCLYLAKLFEKANAF